MGWTAFFLKYKFVIIFYALVILFLWWKRKKVERQFKIIFLYRTKLGLKFIKKFASRYKEWVKLFGYIGIGAGYVGLLLISFFLVQNLITLITTPEAPAGVSLVLPGVRVPGVGILSFWYWIIAIFLVALVHEFSHGIVAKAHGNKVKATGLVLIGPIIGAFVEPDEEKLKKKSDVEQYSIFAAGPFSNILFALLSVLILSWVFTPLTSVFIEPAGISFSDYYKEGFPAEEAGLNPGELIIGVNNKSVDSFSDFSNYLQCVDPGEVIMIEAENENYTLITTENPSNEGESFIGVINIRNEFVVKEKYKNSFWEIMYGVLRWLANLFRWLFVLNFGIGLFNLLPLPIVDGGRMLQVTLKKTLGKERGNRWFGKISLLFLLLLLLNLFFPWLRGFF